MAMEIDESVQCGRKSSRFCSGKKCSHFHSHHQILTYLLLVRYILWGTPAESVSEVQFRCTSSDVKRYGPILELQECLDSPATVGTSCWAPFARHLSPGTFCQAPLAGLTIIPCCEYFFSEQTVAAAAVEVNDRAWMEGPFIFFPHKMLDVRYID